MYVLSQFNTQTEIPINVSLRLIRILCLIVSNSALSSRRTRIETPYSSEFSLKLLIMLVRAVSGMWDVLKHVKHCKTPASKMLQVQDQYIVTVLQSAF